MPENDPWGYGPAGIEATEAEMAGSRLMQGAGGLGQFTPSGYLPSVPPSQLQRELVPLGPNPTLDRFLDRRASIEDDFRYPASQFRSANAGRFVDNPNTDRFNFVPEYKPDAGGVWDKIRGQYDVGPPETDIRLVDANDADEVKLVLRDKYGINDPSDSVVDALLSFVSAGGFSPGDRDLLDQVLGEEGIL